MGQRRVVLTGLARDVHSILPGTIERMENLGELFADYRVVLYENDSQDNTRDILLTWSRRNHRVTLLSEVRHDPVNPPRRCLKRASRMAYYRNQCHRYIADHLSDFDDVIVVDTDLQGGWSYDGVANTFGHADWDFVGAYSIMYRRLGFQVNKTLHYDAWAYRRHGSDEPLATPIVNAISWPRGAPLVPLYSCFGGLGVYRFEAFLAGRYDGHDCEHVGFHRTMRQRGFARTFLNPSQITLYGRRRRKLDPLFRMYHRIVSAATRRPSPIWYHA